MQDNGQPRKIDIALKILSYVLGLPLLAGFVWISGKFTGLLLFAVITGVCLILAIFVELYSVFIAKRNHLPLFMAGLWAMAGIWTAWFATENMRMILYMLLAVILYFVIMWVINDGHGIKGLFMIHRSQVYAGLAMWFAAFARFPNQPDIAIILIIAIPFYLWIGLAFHLQESIHKVDDANKSYYETDHDNGVSTGALWFYRIFTVLGIVCALVVIIFFKYCRDHRLLEARQGQPAPTFLGLIGEVIDTYQKGTPPPPDDEPLPR
ncbi:MAG: hypothetical protein SGI98_07125 [Verrucomicrobiota bacterium]|nr:hypothetical protein [Verrucomicrobiota bacterium]